MRFARTLALALLTAVPALADPAEEYERLREAMPTILFGDDTFLQFRLQTEVLARLEGRWITLSPLMKNGVTFPDAALMAKVCDRAGLDVVPNGTMGLTLTQKTKADPFVIQLRYVGATTYISTFDEAGALARYFPDKAPAELKPETVYPNLVLNSWLGYISLLPLGEDLVLLQPLARPPELLARCT